MKPHRSPSRWRALLSAGLLPLLLWVQAPAHAEGDPPGRVGRLADLQGQVSVYDTERGDWSAAQRNRPLSTGDRLSTGAEARAELRIGSTTVRLAGGSELEVLALDDQRLQFQLHAGSLALRVRSREVAAEIEIVTAEARLRPLRSGSYRVDRQDDATWAGSLRGDLQIDDADGFTIETGRRVELWREGTGRSLRHAWTVPPDDAFAAWVASADRDDERSAASRFVSPEMTGIEDLDRHGRWDRHPEYGAVWVPQAVLTGWAPYRYGQWAYLRPRGWTWIDDAPWGFAPFHYGRWVHWGGRWGWVPGAYVVRPVYAPALVAWIGGAPAVRVIIGGPLHPGVGWVPLTPREVFVPTYAVAPIFIDRAHGPPRAPGRLPPPAQWPARPVLPGAVPAVPHAGVPFPLGGIGPARPPPRREPPSAGELRQEPPPRRGPAPAVVAPPPHGAAAGPVGNPVAPVAPPTSVPLTRPQPSPAAQAPPPTRATPVAERPARPPVERTAPPRDEGRARVPEAGGMARERPALR